jgi:hypothetical protein
MSEMLRLSPTLRMPPFELSSAERAQLNVIIDLLIPSDKDFPPPSSLDLIDELLRHLRPNAGLRSTLTLSARRLQTVLQELNASADGNFCQAPEEHQQKLLRQLEQRDPAFFQTLWTLVNHGYYKHLAFHPFTPITSQAHSNAVIS